MLFCFCSGKYTLDEANSVICYNPIFTVKGLREFRKYFSIYVYVYIYIYKICIVVTMPVTI